MSKNYDLVQCKCIDEFHLENCAESNDAKSNDLNNSPDTCKSNALSKYNVSEDVLNKSIVVETLKKIDSNRISMINLQNVKISVAFPKAS